MSRRYHRRLERSIGINDDARDHLRHHPLPPTKISHSEDPVAKDHPSFEGLPHQEPPDPNAEPVIEGSQELPVQPFSFGGCVFFVVR